MIVLVWLIEKLSTLINWLGILGWIYVFTEGDPVYVYYAIPLLIVGFIFGLFTYDYDMPPRWLWVKTRQWRQQRFVICQRFSSVAMHTVYP